LDVRLWLSDPRDLTAATARLRRLFDLDADPIAVADRLGPDPLLGPLVARTPGLRAPGAVDPRELAVRAVLGQQVSVVAARRLGAALVAGYGTPLPAVDGGLTHLFPTAERLATADLGDLGMPASRRATLRAMAAALTGGEVSLDAGADRAETQRALLGLPGVGPWTAGYIRMRGLGDPDVALPGDAAVRATLARIGAPGTGPDPAAGWRPWRTYATHHLWRLAATADRR
jgi:AraC family transcriptional regulator of adaptative response / DNA-3-methyladenine glycosylase II